MRTDDRTDEISAARAPCSSRQVFIWAPVDTGEVLDRLDGKVHVRASRMSWDHGVRRPTRDVVCSSRTVLVPEGSWDVGPDYTMSDLLVRKGPVASHVTAHDSVPGLFNLMVYGPRAGRLYQCLNEKELRELRDLASFMLEVHQERSEKS